MGLAPFFFRDKGAGRMAASSAPGTASALAAGMLACLVGFGGALSVVLAAAAAVGATPGQTASWVAGLCIAIAASTGWLSLRFRLPIVTAWSTPGAAVIAARRWF